MVDWKLVVRYSGRLALIVVIGWMAVWTLAVFGTRRRTPDEDAAVPADVVAPPAAAVQLTDFFDGRWSFDEGRWAMGISRVAHEQLEARLLEPPDRAAPPAPAAAASALPAVSGDDRNFIPWLRRMGMKAQRRGQWEVYRYGGPTFRVVAFVDPRGGQEHVALLRFAAGDGEKGWLVVETQEVAAVPPAAEDGSRLPLPPSARRSGTRRDRHGRILSEILTFKGQIAAIRRAWEQQGWKIEDADPPAAASRHLRCQRGQQAWHAWLRQEDDGGGSVLIVREPGA